MTRKLWQLPWGYPESALIVAGVAFVGFQLQLTVGHFDFGLLHYPANFIALAVLIGLIALGVRFQNNPLIRWFAGIPLAVTLTVALLISGFYMGLTPQLLRLPPHASDLISRLGFRMVTSSWPFVLLYSLTIVALGITTLKRLLRFSRRDITFVCNHLGLWILLVAGGLGAADMIRVVMHVKIGETQWRVFDKDGNALELPIAITLKKFTMEEFPPKLTIIDNPPSQPQPEDDPQPESESRPETKRKQTFFQLDPKRPTGRIGDWAITLDEYLHTAVRVSGEFRANPMPQSTPAAKVTAKNLVTGETRTGWVSSGGNVREFFTPLPLDDRDRLIMTMPEPRRFASDITIIPKDGTPFDATLEVNHPITVGHWKLYQYGYETNLGKMSPWSEIELIYDPWLRLAQVGMGFMLIGALLFVWNGTGAIKRRNAK